MRPGAAPTLDERDLGAPAATAAPGRPPLRIMRAVVIGLAAVQTWGSRDSMVADGISYLEIGEHYFAGDWSGALNGYWSPLYSIVLGFFSSVLDPSPRWEFTVLHLANFAVFLAAMAGFEFFYRNALRVTGGGARSDSAAWIFGYTVFAWCTLALITTGYVTPDLLLTALLFLAGGLALNPATLRGSSARAVAVGATLGLAFLTKAALFPVTLVALGTGFLAFRTVRAARSVALAALGFAVVAGPFIAALSVAKGRVTFGESGKLVYAWFIDRGIPMAHWQGASGADGVAAHPTRLLMNDPRVFEFATPIPGTYPVWYDPSYWYEGVETAIRPANQVNAILDATTAYLELFGALAVAMLVLALAGRGGPRRLRALLHTSIVTVPALAGLAMYMLVIVESRYAAPFATLLALTLFAALRSRTVGAAAGVPMAVAIATAVVLGTITLRAQAPIVATAAADIARGFPPSEPLRVATGLRAMGLTDGDAVAQMVRSEAYALGPYWARLARVRIVADVATYPPRHEWLADPVRRSDVLDALRSAGARAVVTDAPMEALGSGWEPIDGTGYAVLLLDR